MNEIVVRFLRCIQGYSAPSLEVGCMCSLPELKPVDVNPWYSMRQYYMIFLFLFRDFLCVVFLLFDIHVTVIQ